MGWIQHWQVKDCDKVDFKSGEVDLKIEEKIEEEVEQKKSESKEIWWKKTRKKKVDKKIWEIDQEFYQGFVWFCFPLFFLGREKFEINNSGNSLVGAKGEGVKWPRK